MLSLTESRKQTVIAKRSRGRLREVVVYHMFTRGSSNEILQGKFWCV